MKLHIFATIHKVNTYSEKLFPPMTVHRFGVDLSEIMTSRETKEFLFKYLKNHALYGKASTDKFKGVYWFSFKWAKVLNRC